MGYCLDPVLSGRRMIWIAGPRQAGKTFLAKEHLRHCHCERLYYNWDDPVIRRRYLQDPVWFESEARQLKGRQPWVVFDEIHKRPRWRDILKGAYDRFHEEFRFMVTGSPGCALSASCLTAHRRARCSGAGPSWVHRRLESR